MEDTSFPEGDKASAGMGPLQNKLTTAIEEKEKEKRLGKHTLERCSIIARLRSGSCCRGSGIAEI